MSDVLQFVGGFFEIVGLASVALGIVETRRAFTDRPGVLQKVASAVAGFVARLTGRERRSYAEGGGSVSVKVTTSGHGHQRYGFKGSLEERVRRLQEIVQEHESRLDEIAERVRSQSDELRVEIRSLQDALSESERELTERIRAAASNGLTLETWGVFLFIIGVGLTTWGGLIA